MIELLSHSLQELVVGMSRNVLRVLGYPFNPGERLYVLYLATSLLMAAAVWTYVYRRERQSGGTPVTLKEFLFPASIWRTTSAWLDVRYFFFHQIFRVFLYGSFALMVSDWSFKTAAELFGSPQDSQPGVDGPLGWLVAIGYGFVSIAVLDLVAWTLAAGALPVGPTAGTESSNATDGAPVVPVGPRAAGAISSAIVGAGADPVGPMAAGSA